MDRASRSCCGSRDGEICHPHVLDRALLDQAGAGDALVPGKRPHGIE